MKSLYESILDDEDVLVSNAKKHLENWLLVLKYAMKNRVDDEELESIVNDKKVKKEVSKIFHQFDGRMKWTAGKLNISPLKTVYCILQDTKERSKYCRKPTIMFALETGRDEMVISIADFDQLTKTAQKNVKESELLKFKQYLLDNGARYSKTGIGLEIKNTLLI